MRAGQELSCPLARVRPDPCLPPSGHMETCSAPRTVTSTPHPAATSPEGPEEEEEEEEGCVLHHRQQLLPSGQTDFMPSWSSFHHLRVTKTRTNS